MIILDNVHSVQTIPDCFKQSTQFAKTRILRKNIRLLESFVIVWDYRLFILSIDLKAKNPISTKNLIFLSLEMANEPTKLECRLVQAISSSQRLVQAATLDVRTLQTSEMWRPFFVAMNCSASSVFTRTRTDQDLFESVNKFVRGIPVKMGGEKGGGWVQHGKLFFTLSLAELTVLSEFCSSGLFSVNRLFYGIIMFILKTGFLLKERLLLSKWDCLW